MITYLLRPQDSVIKKLCKRWFSLQRQGTLGYMKIRLYTNQCDNLTLKRVNPYTVDTVSVDLTLDNLLRTKYRQTMYGLTIMSTLKYM